MIFRLENVYDSFGNAAFDQVGLRHWGPHLPLGDGVRLGATWKPLALQFQRKSGRRLPELTMLTGYALVATEQTCELVTAFMGESVEALPLKSTGEPWLVLNVVELVAGRDPRKGEGRPIFKLAEVTQSPIYVGDDFKALVESERFKGVRFVPVRQRR